MSPLLSLIVTLLLSLSPSRAASSSPDSSRLGSEYTSLPLYRNGAGTNVLAVGVGTPAVEMNLTCSTNVAFFVVATSSCEDCTQDSKTFDITASSSLTTTRQALDYTFVYPAGTLDTLSVGGQLGSEVLTDERDETTTRPIALAATVQENDENANLGGTSFKLSDGTAGFWGMGVYQETKSLSMIPAMTQVSGDGTAAQTASFTVGFDINNYSTDSTVQAGTVHWGAVPSGSYDGDFNWLDANTSVAGSWGFGLDSLRVEGTVIDLSHTYGSIDPGFDAIYVPTSIAEAFFAKVSGASRDTIDTTRWNLPCNTNISMTVTISGTEYAVSSSQLVQPRDAAGVFCWGAVVAWQNGSVPEAQGEVRLGTPFMSNVYTALYYSDSNQYVGIAGKPDSVNASDLVKRSDGHRNSKLAGILIGSLLGALIILFLICYSRNRNSFQSIWYRAIRRQNRAQMNMMVRSATLPPPMMAMPMPMPMAGVPMGVPLPMMAGGMPVVNPAMRGMMMPPPGAGAGGYGYQPVPPPYQMPMTVDLTSGGYLRHGQGQQQLPTVQQDQPSQPQPQPQQLPQAIDHRPQGYYSPRQQSTSPPRSNTNGRRFLPFRAPTSVVPQGPQGVQSSQTQGVPESGGSKVHWGPTAARQMRSASAASAAASGASVNEFGAYHEPLSGRYPQRPSGMGREARHEEFMRRYSGQHNPATQVGMMQSTPMAPPTHEAGAGGEREKKKYFAWRGSDSGQRKGEFQYASVPVDGEKGRSWFGVRSNRSQTGSATPSQMGVGWKDAERAMERQRLSG